jgi:hypothetical protein
MEVGAGTPGSASKADQASAGDLVAKANKDAQTLQAWSDSQRAIEFSSEELRLCDGPDPTSDGEISVKDCARLGLAKARMDNRSVVSPSAGLWRVPVYRRSGDLLSDSGAGTLVEIRLVVSRAVLAAETLTGIGFYTENLSGSGVVLTPKDQLHIVSTQDVTLKRNGESAVVLRFVLWMPQDAGESGTGWGMDNVRFKPFAEFRANGTTYDNWEDVATNWKIYRLPSAGGSQQTASFDREGDLLFQ